MRLAFPGLMAALAEGATVVAPTPVLASVAVEQFNREKLARGEEAWQRPDIQSMDAWMTNQWQQARFVMSSATSLLSLAQERELWRQIIERERPDLFDLRAMASLAQRAARIIAEYQIPVDGEGWFEQTWSEHADAQSFLGWHRAMQKRLKAENWITRADLWKMLPNFAGHGAVTFAALNSVSPGLKRFQGRNVAITPSAQPSMANAIEFESVTHEMEHAARAVRQLLEANDSVSIGILVADFGSHARDLVRILHEVLYPTGEVGDAVHIQFGPLYSHPLISNALLLLELAQPRIHHASAGAILRSPFIDGAVKERSARAMAANFLRRARELDFSLSDMEAASERCVGLQKMFKRVRAVNAKTMRLMRLPDWSATFSDILEAAKWPAIEKISESEQGAVEHWNRALSELASLGLVAPPTTLNQAISHLRAILGRPSEQGDWSSAVQILDASSAEGIEFDHSFVINGCENAWPMPGGLSPLIPYKLQRAHNVLGSHPDSVAEERQRKTRALFTSAPHVHVSFSGNISPALKPYVQICSNPEPVWPGLTATQSYPPVELDAQEDSQAPPLVQLEKVSGGSGIIKSQSQCPFKAFAEYRLKARGEDEACFGFDALARGTFAHTALELVWKTLRDQASLKALSADQIHDLVAQSVENAVQDDGSGPIRTLTAEAERERLTALVSDWLAVEKQRLVPFAVEQLEQLLQVELSGLRLELRVDRIDRLPNGSLVLIDYKTGEQTKKKLENDRPQEPQLLVYAAAVGEQVDGLYFAELRNDGVRAVGHGSGKHFYKQLGVKNHQEEAWDKFVADSEITVHRLAGEFVQGYAAVDPIKNACNYCKVKPMCRIGTAAGGEDDEEWS